MERQRFDDAQDSKRMPVWSLGDTANRSDQRVQEGGA